MALLCLEPEEPKQALPGAVPVHCIMLIWDMKNFDPRYLALRLLEKTQEDVLLISEPWIESGTFGYLDKCLFFSPEDEAKAQAILEEYNELRNSPLMKALR